MHSDRINARLSKPLAEFVSFMVGEQGSYETPSEYIRDLIRRDMEQRESRLVHDAILAGYHDLASGHSFVSQGSFQEDMKLLGLKEKENWM